MSFYESKQMGASKEACVSPASSWHTMAQTATQDIFSQNSKSTWQAHSVLGFKWSLKHLIIREISKEINSKFHSIVSLAENESGFIWDNRLRFFFFCFISCFVVSVSCNLEWPPTHSEAGLDLNSWSSWAHLPRAEITRCASMPSRNVIFNFGSSVLSEVYAARSI